MPAPWTPNTLGTYAVSYSLRCDGSPRRFHRQQDGHRGRYRSTYRHPQRRPPPSTSPPARRSSIPVRPAWTPTMVPRPRSTPAPQPQPCPKPPASGPSTTTPINDSSGNGYDGTPQGTMAYSTDTPVRHRQEHRFQRRRQRLLRRRWHRATRPAFEPTTVPAPARRDRPDHGRPVDGREHRTRRGSRHCDDRFHRDQFRDRCRRRCGCRRRHLDVGQHQLRRWCQRAQRRGQLLPARDQQ